MFFPNKGFENMNMVNVSFHMGNEIRFIIDAINNFSALINSVTCCYFLCWQKTSLLAFLCVFTFLKEIYIYIHIYLFIEHLPYIRL